MSGGLDPLLAQGAVIIFEPDAGWKWESWDGKVTASSDRILVLEAKRVIFQDWTYTDAPSYKDRNSFSKFWTTASAAGKALLSNRQGRTCHVTIWTIQAAVKAFK